MAYTYEIKETDGRVVTWTMESAAPHRILAWQSSDGEAAHLLGSARLAYWQLNGLGQEKQLKLLGLSPPNPQIAPK
jgi:hypothetical protein